MRHWLEIIWGTSELLEVRPTCSVILWSWAFTGSTTCHTIRMDASISTKHKTPKDNWTSLMICMEENRAESSKLQVLSIDILSVVLSTGTVSPFWWIKKIGNNRHYAMVSKEHWLNFGEGLIILLSVISSDLVCWAGKIRLSRWALLGDVWEFHYLLVWEKQA